MNDDQWTVFILILLLLGLEVLRSQAVGGFVKGLLAPFKQASQ